MNMSCHADTFGVLIVEDEEVIRAGLYDLLQFAGVDAIAVGSA